MEEAATRVVEAASDSNGGAAEGAGRDVRDALRALRPSIEALKGSWSYRIGILSATASLIDRAAEAAPAASSTLAEDLLLQRAKLELLLAANTIAGSVAGARHGTFRTLAQQANLSIGYANSIANARVGPPKLAVARRLDAVLGTSIEDRARDARDRARAFRRAARTARERGVVAGGSVVGERAGAITAAVLADPALLEVLERVRGLPPDARRALLTFLRAATAPS